MAIVVVPCGVTLGEVCCVLAMMFEVVMVKESEGSGGCSAGGPLSQCPLTAAAIPLQHKICVVAWNLENFVRHHCSFLHLFRPSFTPPLLLTSFTTSLPSLPILSPPCPLSSHSPQVLERETGLPVMREKRGRRTEPEEDQTMRRKEILVQEQTLGQSSEEGSAEAGDLGPLEEDDLDNEKYTMYFSRVLNTV